MSLSVLLRYWRHKVKGIVTRQKFFSCMKISNMVPSLLWWSHCVRYFIFHKSRINLGHYQFAVSRSATKTATSCCPGRVGAVEAAYAQHKLHSNRAPTDWVASKSCKTERMVQGDWGSVKLGQLGHQFTPSMALNKKEEVDLWQPWSDLGPYVTAGTSIIFPMLFWHDGSRWGSNRQSIDCNFRLCFQ